MSSLNVATLVVVVVIVSALWLAVVAFCPFVVYCFEQEPRLRQTNRTMMMMLAVAIAETRSVTMNVTPTAAPVDSPEAAWERRNRTRDNLKYSGTSDSGHSEEWTTSLQWTNCVPPANNCMHVITSEEGTTSE